MSYPMEGTTTTATMTALLEHVTENGFDVMAKAIQILMNEAMKIERARYLGSMPYERSPERHDYSNGFKNKTVNTRVGSIDLQVPQVRSCEFYPESLDQGLRSEQALRLTVAEMYLQGVSTRKVQKITQILCGVNISSTDVSRATKLLDGEQEKWRNRKLGKYNYMTCDAIYEKVRRDGCVVDSAVLIAYGINEQGIRDVLGISISISEHEVHWRTFFEDLVSRGLHGLEMITSDAHAGLKAAKQAVFPSVPWQRCQFHLQQNASSHISKKSIKKDVAEDIRSIFNAPNRVEADRLLQITCEKYKTLESKLASWMEDNIPESLTVFTRPKEHQKRLRTSNMAERVNKEIRRRTRVVGIFPNEASALRLITSVLSEISDDWQGGKIYLNMNSE